MRLALLLSALVLLTHCSSMDNSAYTAPDDGSRSSLSGSQGGAGVQAPIWSNDPSKSTVTNQKPNP